MDEANGPNDKPNGRTSEERELREIPPDQFKEILENHRKWFESEGKEGERANLGKANLQGANLLGANLQKADLWRANLQKADLFRANLQETNLERANLQEADLRDGKLRGSNFQDADLIGAQGLLAGQLAGANVSGAKLPPDIHTFEEPLKNVEEASKNARKLFFGLLAGCLYAVLTIATTTDARLVTNSASSPLPIIGTQIPIVGFYLAAPLLLLAVYIYFHLYLQRLWGGLAELPAIFPDGRSLDKKAYPWLLIGYIRAHIKLLREEERPLYSRLQVALAILLAWCAVPATLFLVWGRYLPRHDWVITVLHIMAVGVSIGAGIHFQRSVRKTLRGEELKPFSWKMVLREERITKYWLLILGSVAAFFLFSFGAIEGVTGRTEIKGVRLWVPRALDFIGFRAFADLTEKDVSTKPANWTGRKEKAREEIGLVKGAGLEDADLRNAQASGAFLVKAKLRGARLQGAKNLTVKKLSQVKTLYKAKLAPELMEHIKKDYPHLLEKPKEE